MEAIPNDLAAAAIAARDRLATNARQIAMTGARGESASQLMGAMARAAVSSDAFLAALHARLEALRGVTK